MSESMDWKLNILKVFHRGGREHGKFFTASRTQVAEQLGVANSVIAPDWNELHMLRMLQPKSIGGYEKSRWAITDLGLEAFLESEKEAVQQAPSQTIHIGSIEGGSVNIGGTQFNLNADSMVAAFEKALDGADIPSSEKSGLLQKFREFARHPAVVAAIPEFLKTLMGGA